MDNSDFGVILRVENIDICRSFYRDILNLGCPVLDSNFWVEFKLPGGFSLALERKEKEEKLPECMGRISWLCKVDDVNTAIERLGQFGYEYLNVEEHKMGFKLYMFCDPEGNPFYLRSDIEKKNQAGRAP